MQYNQNTGNCIIRIKKVYSQGYLKLTFENLYYFPNVKFYLFTMNIKLIE